MSIQIISLQCPKCGNTDNVPEQELKFGCAFKCRYCSTSSLVIYNHKLYEPRPDDKICIRCGRIGAQGSRFCQCQAPLIQKCINCSREFPIHYDVCDQCGVHQEQEKKRRKQVAAAEEEKEVARQQEIQRKLTERRRIEKLGIEIIVCPKCKTLNSLAFIHCEKCHANVNRVKPIRNPYL